MAQLEHVTIPEAARRLGVSAPTVRRAIDRGDIRAIRIGALYRVLESEIDRIFEAARDGVPPCAGESACETLAR